MSRLGTETACAYRPFDCAGLDQGSGELFGEEGIAAGLAQQAGADVGEGSVAAEQLVEERLALGAAEGLQCDRLVAAAAHPVGLVLGAEVREHEGASAVGRGDQLREERIAVGIDPVQIVEEQNRRRLLAGRRAASFPVRPRGKRAGR